MQKNVMDAVGTWRPGAIATLAMTRQVKRHCDDSAACCQGHGRQRAAPAAYVYVARARLALRRPPARNHAANREVLWGHGCARYFDSANHAPGAMIVPIIGNAEQAQLAQAIKWGIIMDFAGLIRGFKVGRALSEVEIANRLHQKSRLDLEPNYQLCVIKMNSTFLESVDKWYANKGFLTSVAVILICSFAGTCAFFSITWFLQGAGFVARPDGESAGSFFANAIGMAVVMVPMCLGLVWLLKVDAFAYTHYPLRFNRITRMVHVFRKDGSVLSVPWDAVYFTIAPVDEYQKFWNVLGHLTDDKESTVQETFALSMSEIGTAEGKRLLKEHWEFVRRYMEDGPHAVFDKIKFCLPISSSREGFLFGLQRLSANDMTTAPLMWPVRAASMIMDLLSSPFRYFAMYTSRIPEWPADIEAACGVEKDDPYAIEGRADGSRFFLYAAERQ